MQIFVVTLMLLGGLVIPWLTYDTYCEIYRWERRQIAVDNTAIRAGRLQVNVMNGLRKAQLSIDALEKVHHVVHFAKRIPGVNVVATPSDIATEFALHLAVTGGTAAANGSWASMRVGSVMEAARLGTAARLSAPARAPFRNTTCRICGLPNGWTATASRVLSTVQSVGTPTDHRARIHLNGGDIRGQWTYQLLDEQW